MDLNSNMLDMNFKQVFMQQQCQIQHWKPQKVHAADSFVLRVISADSSQDHKFGFSYYPVSHDRQLVRFWWRQQRLEFESTTRKADKAGRKLVLLYERKYTFRRSDYMRMNLKRKLDLHNNCRLILIKNNSQQNRYSPFWILFSSATNPIEKATSRASSVNETRLHARRDWSTFGGHGCVTLG